MARFWVWFIALVTWIMILVDKRDSHRWSTWACLLVLIIFVFSWERFVAFLTKYWRLVWLFMFFKISVWGKCLRACLAGFLRVVDFKFMVLKFFLRLKVFATLVTSTIFLSMSPVMVLESSSRSIIFSLCSTNFVKEDLFSWEPALWYLNSQERVMLRLRSQNIPFQFSAINSEFWA